MNHPAMAAALALLLSACATPPAADLALDASPIRPEQAQSLLEQGRTAEAARMFEQLAKDAKTRPEALQGQGLAALAGHDWNRAETLLRQAVTLDPGQWKAWNGLGVACDAERRWGDAAAAYNKALDLRPDWPVAENNLGYSLLLQGKAADALAWLSKASRAEPRLPAAVVNLRLALATLGRYDDAVADTTVEERPAALNNAGVIAISNGHVALARKLLNQALAASPSYYERARRNLERLAP